MKSLRFSPHIPFELDEFGEWTVPFFSDGGYYIFLEQAFTWGNFGHPWEETMCLFGAPLLTILEECRPAVLANVVRRNGKKMRF